MWLEIVVDKLTDHSKLWTRNLKWGKLKSISEMELMEGQNKSSSYLRDLLIVKILGLLETQDAIRTSVLSKRWEYLWTSVPKLSFTPTMLNNTASLVNVVERALVLRGPADIKEFSLVMPVLSDESRIRAWISAVVRRNVEDLSVCLSNFKGPLQEPKFLPCSLFTSATLVELELMFPCMLKVPCSVSLSRLRSLTLTYLVFSDDYSTQELFSGCPVLEELYLTECSWVNVKFLSICAPKLLELMVQKDARS